MAIEPEEHERTIAFGETALGQIKALGQSASPCSYEIWYHYATGYNAALNDTINEKLTRGGGFSKADVEQIYRQFFGSTRTSDHLESIGGKVMDKIDQIMSVLDTAVGSTSRHSESLADMSDQLGHIEDGTDVGAIIEGLLQTVRAMKEDNRELESRLSASKEEITELQQSLEVVRSESLIDPLTTLG
ncbi:MAG: cell division protein ZapB, partial [Xanthobacteraceae bacterium]